MFEYWASEEYDHQKHSLCGVEEGDRPQTKQLEHRRSRYIVFMEHIDGDDGADNGGEGHRPCSGAYRRGRIASECWRRSCRRRQVERDHVEEHI